MISIEALQERKRAVMSRIMPKKEMTEQELADCLRSFAVQLRADSIDMGLAKTTEDFVPEDCERVSDTILALYTYCSHLLNRFDRMASKLEQLEKAGTKQ